MPGGGVGGVVVGGVVPGEEPGPGAGAAQTAFGGQHPPMVAAGQPVAALTKAGS
jgi:hypothetical protein